MTRVASTKLVATLVLCAAGGALCPGPDGADRDTEVTITNTSHARVVAFFIRADLRPGIASRAPVRSALWSDNDITLWPGESQTLSVTYRSADLHGARPAVKVGAWNRATRTLG